MEIPNRFKNLRTEKGFSVYRLAKVSDISENYIHKIEKGESQPSVYILEKLLSCLGTTPAEFLNENSAVMYPSDFERELVETVRVLPKEKADAVLHIAKLMGE
ncbi:MAG: helix-turn-helix transcriptional regulator [Lachnospiraceae bacterium]|nr:helix-turn-helix transcriptional regulator [Lachnospiraceae bacterium]